MYIWEIIIFVKTLEQEKNTYDFLENLLVHEMDLHETLQEKINSYYDIRYTLNNNYFVPNERKVYIFLEEF